MKKLLALASVLSVLALVACGSSSSSKTVNSCVVAKGSVTQQCVQFTTEQTAAGCKASASDVGSDDTTGMTITAATSCPSGSKADCAIKDSTGKKIGTFYGYDSTATIFCAVMNAL